MLTPLPSPESPKEEKLNTLCYQEVGFGFPALLIQSRVDRDASPRQGGRARTKIPRRIQSMRLNAP